MRVTNLLNAAVDVIQGQESRISDAETKIGNAETKIGTAALTGGMTDLSSGVNSLYSNLDLKINSGSISSVILDKDGIGYYISIFEKGSSVRIGYIRLTE